MYCDGGGTAVADCIRIGFDCSRHRGCRDFHIDRVPKLVAALVGHMHQYLLHEVGVTLHESIAGSGYLAQERRVMLQTAGTPRLRVLLHRVGKVRNSVGTTARRHGIDIQLMDKPRFHRIGHRNRDFVTGRTGFRVHHINRDGIFAVTCIRYGERLVGGDTLREGGVILGLCEAAKIPRIGGFALIGQRGIGRHDGLQQSWAHPIVKVNGVDGNRRQRIHRHRGRGRAGAAVVVNTRDNIIIYAGRRVAERRAGTQLELQILDGGIRIGGSPCILCVSLTRDIRRQHGRAVGTELRIGRRHLRRRIDTDLRLGALGTTPIVGLHHCKDG